MQITFFGVRGSCPCPSPQNQRYGGNTACTVLDPAIADPKRCKSQMEPSRAGIHCHRVIDAMGLGKRTLEAGNTVAHGNPVRGNNIRQRCCLVGAQAGFRNKQ